MEVVSAVLLLNKCNANVPQKLFSRSLDRLQVRQVELQETCFLSSALLQVANSIFTLGLVATSNINLGIFCEKDLTIGTSA
jgi:hypothetical protein